jgi:tRNA1Val (adenine37-N6)-methyltransferase
LLNASNPQQILDVGSGTGVLSLMMAQQFPEASITGVEIDKASFLECTENFQNSLWKNRLSSVQSDFIAFEEKNQFDLIVSNPPYYQSRLENDDVRKSQARHESALPMMEMIRKVDELLSENGALWVIVPSEVSQLWIESAARRELYPISNILMLGKEASPAKRNIICFKRILRECEMSELVIRKSNGNYTDQYIELTKEFHFNKLS